MTDNVKSYEVILLDHAEPRTTEQGVEYLSIFGIGDVNYKINASRKPLWDMFLSANRGTPFLLFLESFTPDDKPNEVITYVANAKKADFEAVWQSGIQSTLKRLLTAKDDDRQRSQALSYAKDIYVASMGIEDNIDTDKVVKVATTFFAFIKGIKEVELTSYERINGLTLSEIADEAEG